MKKKIIIIVSIIAILILAVGSAYLVDRSRMNSNKPVIFSTWGYEYAPPEISGKEVQVTDRTVNEKQAIYDQSGDFLSITLPEEWNYQVITEQSEQYEYGIKIYLDDSEKYAAVYSYKNLFGVCGTGLECEDIVSNDGIAISVGYYGNDWSFMAYDYEDKEIVALNNGLKDETAKKAIEILKTVKVDKKYEAISSGENDGNNTSAYIPDGMNIASKDDVGVKTEDVKFNRNKENVAIEVLEDTVTSTFYGNLDAGIYRIVKDTYDKGYIYFYSNEFEVK